MIFLLFVPPTKIMSPFLHSSFAYKGMTRQELLFSGFFLLAIPLFCQRNFSYPSREGYYHNTEVFPIYVHYLYDV